MKSNNRQSRWSISLLIVCAAVVVSSELAAAPAKRTLRVGLLADGPLKPEFQELFERLRAETKLVFGSSAAVEFPQEKRLYANWAAERVRANADAMLADRGVDVVLVFGFLSAIDVGQRRDLPKPVLVPWAPDPAFSGLPLKGRISGWRNFSYLVYPRTFDEDILTFKRLTRAKTVHVLADAIVLKRCGAAIEALRKRAEKASRLTLAVVSVDPPTAASALAAIPKRGVEAIYVSPQVRMSDAERTRLFAGLRERRLPSFSMLGRAEVERGILATQTRGLDMLRVARRTALNIERIARGEKPETFPVFLQRRRSLLINMETARAIGYSPSWEVLTYAELYKENAASGRRLGLKQAVQEALKRNWDLLAAQQGLHANTYQLKAAYSPFGPRVDFVGSHRTLRKATAEASNGTQPWHQGSVAAQLTQPVVVEPLYASLTVNKHRRRGLQADYRALKLDLVADTASAFIRLLKALANAEVRRSNAQVTAENLEAANVQQQIGSAGPSDVYRWQSQLANDRNLLIQARTEVNVAQIALNRLLRRPQSQRISPEPPSRSDPTMVPQAEELVPYLENPIKFEVFADFLVGEAIAASPELRRIDADVKAQQRAYLSKQRALWLPQLSLAGELSYIAYRKFTDAAPIQLPGFDEPIVFSLNRVPRFGWYLGAQLSLPLFTSLQQSYEREEAERLVYQLRDRRRALSLRVESRVRTALNNVRAARAGIHFARRAASAAAKNFEVVQDGYSRGVATLVRLLDAQNQALTTRLVAATAVYDFQLALIELQRSTASFQMFTSVKARRLWFSRLKAYYRGRGQMPS